MRPGPRSSVNGVVVAATAAAVAAAEAAAVAVAAAAGTAGDGDKYKRETSVSLFVCPEMRLPGPGTVHDADRSGLASVPGASSWHALVQNTSLPTVLSPASVQISPFFLSAANPNIPTPRRRIAAGSGTEFTLAFSA